MRDTAYIQWDPVTVVAPSHLLSLLSRIGSFSPSDLERLLWDEKKVFEHWTPIGSLVLTEDYPIYYSLMMRYPGSLSSSWGRQKEWARKFIADHPDVRTKVIRELRKGPRKLGQFEGHSKTPRSSGGWDSGGVVSDMLSYLNMAGEVMVVGHEGNNNIWGLTEEFLPAWVERKLLPQEDVEYLAAQRAIRALGTATPKDINYYFVRGRYLDLRGTLKRLLEDSRIHRIRVEGVGGRDERYIHHDDVALLDSMSTDDWEPRMSLLPPFDNLICSTSWTSRLFSFEYIREQFLPKEKRRFGTYVLPILWGDRFIGRIDPKMDRETGVLTINSVHAEADAPSGSEVASEISETIERLGQFLGAGKVVYTSRVPAKWKGTLK